MSETETGTAPVTDDTPPAEATDGTAPAEVSQCAYKTDKGVRCKLSAGHDAGENPVRHKMRLPATTGGLPGGFSKPIAEDVPASERITSTSRAAERSEDQRAFDVDMLGAWHLWDEAGRADKFENMPHKRYLVDPESVDAVLAMMRIAVGSGSVTKGKKLHYRRGSHTSGKVIIEYAVSNPPVKVVPAVTNAAGSENATPPNTEIHNVPDASDTAAEATADLEATANNDVDQETVPEMEERTGRNRTSRHRYIR